MHRGKGKSEPDLYLCTCVLMPFLVCAWGMCVDSHVCGSQTLVISIECLLQFAVQFVCACMCMHVYVSVCLCVCLYMPVYVCVYVCVDTCVCVRSAHVCICIYV